MRDSLQLVRWKLGRYVEGRDRARTRSTPRRGRGLQAFDDLVAGGDQVT